MKSSKTGGVSNPGWNCFRNKFILAGTGFPKVMHIFLKILPVQKNMFPSGKHVIP